MTDSMVTKIVGVAVAILVVAIVMPIGLNELGGMSEENVTASELYSTEISGIGSSTFDLTLDDDQEFAEGTVRVDYNLAGDNTENITVEYLVDGGTKATPVNDETLSGSGSLERDITDSLTGGTQEIKVIDDGSGDNFDSLESELLIEVETETTLGDEYDATITLLTLLLPVLAVISIILYITGRI